MHRLKSFLTLKTSLILASVMLLTVLCSGLFLFMQNANRASLMDGALQQQSTSLRVLTSTFESRFDGLSVNYSADGMVRRVDWAAIPDMPDHDLIDRVGQISGETATVFVWDPTERDFIRQTTNIIKPDGQRAVGTYLGRTNPVHAAMLRGETYRGEATILGKPYLTIYQPIIGQDRSVIGIFYVGVERTAIDAAIAKSTTASLIIAGSIILAGAGLLAGLIFVLLRPLGDIARTIKQVADGDLDTRIPFTDRSDQIGAIACQIESFQHKLKQSQILEDLSASKKAEQELIVSKLRRALEKLADKDLSPRIIADSGQEFSADYTGLRDDFNNFVSSLSAIISEVGDIASSVDQAAAGIGSGSSDLALRIERQANTLAESAAALDGLALASTDIVAKADQADNVAKTSQTLSAESRKALDAAMGSINKIEASSGAINQIITVIEDIAFQTNLLALNAGVEAARAGEAGRGFAVVASEVRGLAKNATDSAQQIKKLILSSNEQVKEGNQLVQNTGQVLGQVLAHVETLGSLVSDIAGEVRNQADSLEQVNGGVRQLDHMTQQNAAMVEETNAAVQQLRKEASRLSSTLSGFRTGGQVTSLRSAATVNDRELMGFVKMGPAPQNHARPARTGTGPAVMDWADF